MPVQRPSLLSPASLRRPSLGRCLQALDELIVRLLLLDLALLLGGEAGVGHRELLQSSNFSDSHLEIHTSTSAFYPALRCNGAAIVAETCRNLECANATSRPALRHLA